MSASTATTRRFEFAVGTSSKFWQVDVLGAEVKVHFGRIGTAGQTTTKSFADEEAAAKHVAKVTREKLAKGYKEVAA